MQGLDYEDVSYCMYGCDYRKRTRLWGTMVWRPRPLCVGNGCGRVVGGRHPQVAQKAGNKSLGQRNHKSQEIHTVPKALVDDIARTVARQVTPSLI